MSAPDHILNQLNAATKLAEHGDREMWKPDRDEQLSAIEILLASSIPSELRRHLRERELEIATQRKIA